MAVFISYPYRLSSKNHAQLPIPLSTEGIRSSSFLATNTSKLNTALSQTGRFLPYQAREVPGRPHLAGGFESELNCSRKAAFAKHNLFASRHCALLGERASSDAKRCLHQPRPLRRHGAPKETFAPGGVELESNCSRPAVTLRFFGRASLKRASATSAI